MMRCLYVFIVLVTLISCSTNLTLPKANIVKESERTLEKAERAIISNDTEAKELIEASLSLSLATNIPDLKIRSYLFRVHYEIKEGNIDKALKNLNMAKEVSLNENPELMPYISYYEYLIGYISNNQEKINQLLEDTTNYPDNVLTAIYLLKSLIYIKANNFKLAEEYAQKSLKLSDKKNFLIEKSYTLKILSYINLRKNNTNEAIKMINESLSIDRSLNLLDYLYWDLEALARIYWISRDKEKAIYYYKSAYELALSNKNEAKSNYFKLVIDNLLK